MRPTARCIVSSAAHEAYDATCLTPEGARGERPFLSWEEQPSPFKHYPDFLPRLLFDDRPLLRALHTARSVTDVRDFDGKPYYRLSTPSAGNLHPVELYVQFRGVEGIASGVYHLDALNDALVMIVEVGTGLEPMLGYAHRFEGALILLSLVPYRSEWKYGHRAWRYCFMDAGHQAGALLAAFNTVGMQAAATPKCDRAALNAFMGFDDQEFTCLAFAVGKEGTRRARVPKHPLMRVMPTDYSHSDGVVASWLLQSGQCRIDHAVPFVSDAPQAVQLSRRSARSFSGQSLPAAGFEHIMHLLTEPPAGMTAYGVVLDSEREQGVWKHGILQCSGAFGTTLAALLVGQRFVADAGMVMVLTAPQYRTGLQLQSAAFGHRIGLDAAGHGIGYSAIGAFFDKELQEFLSTSESILYVGVFGMEEI